MILFLRRFSLKNVWIPAFAGMTPRQLIRKGIGISPRLLPGSLTRMMVVLSYVKNDFSYIRKFTVPIDFSAFALNLLLFMV